MWKTLLMKHTLLNKGHHFIIPSFKEYKTRTYLSNEIMIILQYFSIGLFNMCFFYILKVLEQNGMCDCNYYHWTNHTKIKLLPLQRYGDTSMSRLMLCTYISRFHHRRTITIHMWELCKMSVYALAVMRMSYWTFCFANEVNFYFLIPRKMLVVHKSW